MGKIHVLDALTINKIAAGEVIERPKSVVKELVENSIDSQAGKITVEIRDGGVNYIRVTDDGSGFYEDDIKTAFVKHATSKLRTVEDLLSITSLGFRGEALASIGAVARVELITKREEELLGHRYIYEGGTEVSFDEIGCPTGTTIIVRDLFYNVPARRKFLKSFQAEGSQIADAVSTIALSRPDISFTLIQNNRNTFFTSGNGSLKDCVYQILGREAAKSMLDLETVSFGDGESKITVSGQIASPVVAKGTRSFEFYFINKRFIKNAVINQAIEDAYRSVLMGGKYPCTLIFLEMSPELYDVNVHPAKTELRFSTPSEVYNAIFQCVKAALDGNSLLPKVELVPQDKGEITKEARLLAYSKIPEPFEKKRENQLENTRRPASDNSLVKNNETQNSVSKKCTKSDEAKKDNLFEKLEINNKVNEVTPDNKRVNDIVEDKRNVISQNELKNEVQTKNLQKNAETFVKAVEKPSDKEQQKAVQLELDVYKEAKQENFNIIGQVFNTYWIVEYQNEMLIIDQHAAHEKVLYEENVRRFAEGGFESQMVAPPIVISVNRAESLRMTEMKDLLSDYGFEIEESGMNEYLITEIPATLTNIDAKALLFELLETKSIADNKSFPTIICDKLATMSCKAAIKGNNHIDILEMKTLLEKMFKCQDPEHCPHGRPTTIRLSKYEIEKMFKRIV